MRPGSETRWPCFLASAGYWPKSCFIRFLFDSFVSFVYSISYFLYTRMSTITTEQLSTILVEKLDEKLAPLNSTVVELRKFNYIFLFKVINYACKYSFFSSLLSGIYHILYYILYVCLCVRVCVRPKFD